MQFLNTLVDALKPFIAGFFLAYILSVPCGQLEIRLRKKIKQKTAEYLSVFIVEVCFFCLLSVFLVVFLPLCIEGINNIIQNLPAYVLALRNSLIQHFGMVDWVNKLTVHNLSDKFVKALQNKYSSDITELANHLYSGTIFVGSLAVSVLLALIANIFIVIDRHNLSKGIKTFLAAFLPKHSENILKGIVKINIVFRKFVVGKTIDSCIIWALVLIILLFFKIPYALPASAFIGITNMIPIVGPIIGAIPGLLLIAGTEPSKVLSYIIIILIIQQIDGHIIGPKCIGSSIGLNTFWVLFAVVVGGKLFGVIGMFFGVPIFTVIYTTFCEYVQKKADKEDVKQKIKDEEIISIE